MYITREGDPLYKSIVRYLTDDERGRFIRNLKKEGAKIMGFGFKKITIKDYFASDRKHADEKEIITEEMMRRAYWAIWEGREDCELSDAELYSPYCSSKTDEETVAFQRYILARREERSRY